VRRRSHRRHLHPLVITALMLFALFAITYYAFNEGLPFVHKFTVNAVVQNSVNVRSGDPVRIAGIDVGEVSGVAPDGDASKITFTLNSNGLPVHRNATVRIRDRLFLEGSYYLALDPGTPSAPMLHDGGMIPESQTTSPVQFFQVLSTFDIAARANLKSLVGALARGFGSPAGKPLSSSGAGGLRSTAPQLRPALTDVSQVTRALRGTQPNDVGRLLTSASAVTGTLGGSSAQLAQLVSGLDVSSQALVASDGALAQSVSGLDETLRSAPTALTAIDHVLPPVRRLAVALDPSLKLAPPLVSSLSNTVSQLATVLGPMERGHLLLSLKATFEQFPSVLSELAQAFPITKQVSDCLRTHEIVPDGSLSTGRPVWQDFVHFLPGVGGASASFDANGPYTRVLAAAGTNTISIPGSGTGGLLGGLLGTLVGTGPPGGGSLLGARPEWIGTLTSSDFRPDVPCSTQALPSLASKTASIAARQVHSSSAPALSPAQLRKLTSARTSAGSGGAG
jgi:phospholipid/cholesterol/gamma-HCH transport system substrate-binding protein